MKGINLDDNGFNVDLKPTPTPTAPSTSTSEAWTSPVRRAAQLVVDLYNQSEVNGMAWGSHADEAIAELAAALGPAAARTPPTQRERVEALLLQLRTALPKNNLRATADDFARVVGEAQNGPPLGEADGSMDTEYWFAAREVARSLSTLCNYLHNNNWLTP